MTELAERGGGREVAVAGQEHDDLPLVAHDILEVLREELADSGLYRRYVDQYVAMWPGRHRRLVSALNTEDHEAFRDAVLSVKTSAGMLGALRLEQLALEMEDAVRKQRMERVRTLLTELEICGQLTTEQLRDELAGPA
ncbi:Hpt domain-containing protein [Arthrobacter sp. SAFR-179]|uniref:Hpt domain-containing protein n=1 Tax=Arthrobacter sp. SAFR-179 TaxID=3387279 RepID=UPI003F7C4481